MEERYSGGSKLGDRFSNGKGGIHTLVSAHDWASNVKYGMVNEKQMISGVTFDTSGTMKI